MKLFLLGFMDKIWEKSHGVLYNSNTTFICPALERSYDIYSRGMINKDDRTGNNG